jgi:hypothetical protein
MNVFVNFEGESDLWLIQERERLRNRLDEIEGEIRRRQEKGASKEWSADSGIDQHTPRFREEL